MKTTPVERQMPRLQRILMKDILINKELQVRPLDKSYVEILIENLPKITAPIVLFHINQPPDFPEGNYLCDGLHRLTARLQVGQEFAEAFVLKGTFDDAYEYAVQSNCSHGHPLTIEERKKAAANILIAHPERSANWISDICGVTDKTVSNIRRELELKKTIPIVKSYIGKDGRDFQRPEYKANDASKMLKLYFNFPNTKMREHCVKMVENFRQAHEIRTREEALELALVEAMHSIPDNPKNLDNDKYRDIIHEVREGIDQEVTDLL